jgi:hypothetical protein
MSNGNSSSSSNKETRGKYIVLPLSAGLSGIVEACSTHPMDRIKTEMQRLALDKQESDVAAAIRSIFAAEGSIKGFYQGLVPRIVGIMPMRLAYWGTLNTMNDVTSASGSSNMFLQYFLPGIVAGSVQSMVDNPIEVVKTKLMTGAKQVSFNHRLYDGFTPLLCRNIVFAIHVAVATKVFGKEHPFLSAAMGGMIGSIVSQPLDVIKTEMQRHQNTTKAQLKPHLSTILAELWQGGRPRMFAGTTMRCTLSFANMGIGFLVLSRIREFVTKALESAPE